MEQPPDSTVGELSEYLTRQLGLLQKQIDSLNQLPGLTALPTKAAPGKVYYFKQITLPWITAIGAWIYKTVPAGSFVVGTNYTVVTLGTTNYTLVGGINTIGTTFTATGVGAGTGTTYSWGFVG
jgi:hypothetical protein